MKKITLLITVAGFLSLQTFGQVATPTTFTRNGVSEPKSANSAMTFVNPGNGVKTQNSNLLKNGGSPAAAVAFSDDFSLPSDTNGLKARGYLPYYRGTGPQGIEATWFQGNPAIWTDFNNGSAEYVSSNYLSATLANDIDNWLVLPALDVAIGDLISFYSRAPLNSSFPDSIRVMYSAVGDSTPEGTSWVQLGNFKVNTTGAWLLDQFAAPAAGTTARFAIRYAVVDGGPNGNNSNWIGIDQLDVYTPFAFDIQALSVEPVDPEYTMLPLSQSTGVSLNATVKNNGLNAATGGTVLFEVIDTVTSGVVFSESVNLPNINPGNTAAVATTGNYTPSVFGNFRSKITVSYPGDGNPANDITQSAPTVITDTIIARDDNFTSGSLGIGAGPAMGIAGQSFSVITATHVTSVSFFMTDGFNPNPAGSAVYATIHNQPAGLNPDNTPLATTTSITITPGSIATGGQWFTLAIDGSSLPISPGQYFVGVHESDSTLTIGTTGQIITPGTVWVTWNSIPAPPAVNGWATADDFGINVTYNLRLNFGTPTAISEVNATTGLISVYPSPASSELTITLDKSIGNATVAIYNALGMLVNTINNVNGSTLVDVAAYAKGVYTLKVTGNGQEHTQRFTVTR